MCEELEMIRMITFAVAGALLSPVSAMAANRACDEFTATKRLYGPSDYSKFISACGLARSFRGNRESVSRRWADCVNRRVDSEKPDSTDEWQKIMTACLLADHH